MTRVGHELAHPVLRCARRRLGCFAGAKRIFDVREHSVDRAAQPAVGQSTEGVGRTNDVTGDLSVAADSVTKAEFVADLTTVKSDKSQRDGQFRGRIMDTDTHPKATLRLPHRSPYPQMPVRATSSAARRPAS